MSQVQTVPVSKIHTEGLQVRAETDRGHIDDLMELFGDDGTWPAALPPLTVFHDSKDYYLADGHHRYAAAQEVGVTEIPCEIRQGSRTDALWFAIGANGDHGKKRTNEDKRRAVLMAYQLDSSLSDREIARRARVSHEMANYTLRALRSRVPLSDSDSGKPELSQKGGRPAGSADDSPAGDRAWYAPGETEESTLTPWDTEKPVAPSSSRPAPIPSTVPASTAASSPGQAAAPTVADKAGPAPDIRTDARGRKMDVSKIGKSQTRPGPSGAVDALGIPLTPATAPAFLTGLEMDAIVKLLREAQTRIGAIARCSGGEMLQNALHCEKSGGEERWRSSDLSNAIKELQHWRPYAAVCPQCRSEPKPTCPVCKGLPYVIRAAFERCPQQLQERVLAMASPAEPETAA